MRMAQSVLLDRPYPTAPVSPLYFDGRKQDLAFEKRSGESPSSRHHVRFWKALDVGDDGRPVWLGAATFDRSVGFSHYTGQFTHHIAPDLDAERNLLFTDLADAKKVGASYSLSGVGPTLFARNGGGDSYYTDGDIAFAELVTGCDAEQAAPAAHQPPLLVRAKNAIFSWLAKMRGALP
jgi:LssY C-terminus